MRAAFVATVAGGALLGGCGDEVTPPPPCPTVAPTVGDACLGSPLPYCIYSFECPGGGYGSSSYECVAGRWVSRGTAKCNPPFDGGPTGDVPGGG